MTHVEQLALAVQAAVLDRLARQLAAVEGAIVRAEALVSDSAAVEGTNERRFDAADDAEGWTTVFEAPEPSLPAERVVESAGASVRGSVDRWSAPMQPLRRREAIGKSESDRRGREGVEPMRGVRRASASEVGIVEDEPSEPMRASGMSRAGDESESIRGLASEFEADRWSRPMRPSSASRAERPSINPGASEARRASSAGARSLTSEEASKLGSSVIGRTALIDPRSPIEPTMSEASEPSEPLNLPAPLRLAEDAAFDRSARVGEASHEPWRGDRPRELGRGPSLARPAVQTRERGELADARTRESSPSSLRELADARTHEPSRSSTREPSSPMRSPSQSSIREPSLDDEFDELARLEEQMADVLERVLMEIGVEP